MTALSTTTLCLRNDTECNAIVYTDNQVNDTKLNDIQHDDTHHNDTQHKIIYLITLSSVAFSISE